MSLYRAGSPARVYVGDALASAVYKGTVKVWQRDPSTEGGTQSVTLTVPAYAAFADVGVIGGGGGGATADNGITTSNGEGGNASSWRTATIPVKPGDTITITIGNGGAGGSGGAKRNGAAGGASTATGPAGLNLNAPGGTGGVGSTTNDDTTGHGAAAVTVNGTVFPGSSNVTAGQPGSQFGGGGGGGPYPGWVSSPAAGGTGAKGGYQIVWRSY
ncbi:hypothetical protein PBI_JEANIE_17 [Gordonia phage Jeanie]|uniref:Glycine-rich domain-containing protein n=2 Tax=root TaxID=1 RepID=A0A160DHI0_9CAUD|nr:hypothetical protein [Gordonia neofelifaecis]YP_009274029.1 minor tail protein [Gordonia phage McGonagall]ANA87595.1 hypothetical protein MCGONAGALL_17 [Gordonia phage McGonagall]ANA87622.1 hypothetical protein PBI_JEANIE_17 [Gordonia phage Jeanie]EGD53197.1 hypothetical protein SCNU_20189 [Gordonia neofelifaecis NRRL B-59395]